MRLPDLFVMALDLLPFAYVGKTLN